MTAVRRLESRSVNRARRLRRDQTDAERAVWRLLSNRQVGGLKFRRQHPIGPYIVDFYCDALGLVVEVDGGQHRPAVDQQRTDYLQSHGLEVLRFWNADVLGNLEGVALTILDRARGTDR